MNKTDVILWIENDANIPSLLVFIKKYQNKQYKIIVFTTGIVADSHREGFVRGTRNEEYDTNYSRLLSHLLKGVLVSKTFLKCIVG